MLRAASGGRQTIGRVAVGVAGITDSLRWQQQYREDNYFDHVDRLCGLPRRLVVLKVCPAQEWLHTHHSCAWHFLTGNSVHCLPQNELSEKFSESLA